MAETPKIEWLRVAAIVPSTAMVFMDQSILPVALPSIQVEFSALSTSLQWTVNSYLLAMAVFILIGGKLADRIGHRKMYLCGMVLFAIFSALCSLSPSVDFLVMARALQGFGAAIMVPSQTALVASSFPPSARGRATGIVVSVGSAFLVIGPWIGGVLIEALSWRWIFWINLPIAVVGILLAFFVLPRIPGRDLKIDWFGFMYFAVFATSSTLFFMQGQDWGWSSVKIIFSAALTLISIFLLIRRDRKAKHPFLELSLFRRPLFVAINVSIAITQIILMIVIFRTVYSENILGYSPSQTGLITSVSALPFLFFPYIGGWLADKVSPKLPIALGYFFLILSFFWLGWTPTPSLVSYLFALSFFGMGIPFILTPSYTMVMSSLDKNKMGIAFGMIATMRMLSASIGLSMIYLFVTLEELRLVPQIGKRLAEIETFSAVHFFLGFLLIIASITAFIFHQRKAKHHPPDLPGQGWD